MDRSEDVGCFASPHFVLALFETIAALAVGTRRRWANNIADSTPLRVCRTDVRIALGILVRQRADTETAAEAPIVSKWMTQQCTQHKQSGLDGTRLKWTKLAAICN